MTGGGSGGHITPILAVAHEIKQLRPDAHIVYIGQKGDPLLDIPSHDPNVEEVYTVPAGKLRRYPNEGWKQFVDVKTQSLNLRDLFRTVKGLAESYRLIRKLKPDVLFTRGGYVSVPVALGAHLNKVPYITHDSDGTPSLANRLIAKWAKLHAVAMPKELYPYPQSKTRQLGVPVSPHFQAVTAELRRQYREELGLADYAYAVLMTGGGNGARALNQALVVNTKYLLSQYPDLVIIHTAGRGLYDETVAAYDALGLGNARGRIVVKDFVRDLYRYSGAADVIIARGGATNIAEFSIQRKACIIVPADALAWSVKDARELAKRGAIVHLSEEQAEQPERLGRAVSVLLQDEAARQRLADALGQVGRSDSAKLLAQTLLQIAQGGGSGARQK